MGISPLQNEEHMQRQEEYVVQSKKTNGPIFIGYPQRRRHLVSMTDPFFK